MAHKVILLDWTWSSFAFVQWGHSQCESLLSLRLPTFHLFWNWVLKNEGKTLKEDLCYAWRRPYRIVRYLAFFYKCSWSDRTSVPKNGGLFVPHWVLRSDTDDWFSTVKATAQTEVHVYWVRATKNGPRNVLDCRGSFTVPQDVLMFWISAVNSRWLMELWSSRL